MITYTDIEYFEKILDKLEARPFFLKRYAGSEQVDLCSYGHEGCIASNILPEFQDFFAVFDVIAAKKMLKHIKHLKRKYTYKRGRK